MNMVKNDGDDAMRNKRIFQRMFLVAVVIFLPVFLLLNCAIAEIATVRNVLIWSQSELGTYPLPKLESNFYNTDAFLLTDGQITSITANWEASGKITLEVSADNGLNFTPVVNGVPLKSNFVSGNRLRWRAQALTDDAKLSWLKITYTDTAGVTGTFGQPELSGFKYRKAIFIRNSSTQDLYNYQIKLRIGESTTVKLVDLNCVGRIQADFKDIRFSATDGQTPLAYYLEALEGQAPDRIATVWLKVPQIPKNSTLTLYLYYGNPDAQDLGDPYRVFDFFEDFKGETLNQDKWVIYTEPKGSIELKPGQVKLDAAELISKNFQFREGIIEYSCEIENGFEDSFNIRNKNDNSYDIPAWVAYSSVYKGAEHCLAVNGIVKTNDPLANPIMAGQKYNYGIKVDSGKIAFERFDAHSQELQASTVYQVSLEPKAGFLSLRSGGDGNGKNIMSFGSIRVRRAAAILPAIESVSQEEAVDLPVFVNTTLSEKGNIVLENDAKSGYYLSSDIASAQPVRIIVPSWNIDSSDKTTNLIGISADQGVTYKNACVKGKFYYASKKDFAVGTGLKLRVDFSRPNSIDLSSGLSMFSLDYRPGKITVISPNGGEVWAQGTEQEITWSAQEYESTYPFNIAYSADAGKNYTFIAGQIPNSGEYLWNIPVATVPRIIIKVADALEEKIFDTSDKAFSITVARETGDYLSSGLGQWSNAKAWAGAKIPGLASEIKITANATIIATEPVSFRSLTIGDGIGKVTTTIVLKAGVNKGCGEITIRKGGKLIQDSSSQISLDGNLTLKSGGLLTHASLAELDIIAQNINLEPEAQVNADGVNEAKGGVIKLSARQDFNIYGVITADGKDGQGVKPGASAGQVFLNANKFGGEKAVIHAQGGQALVQGGAGGEIYVTGNGGKISGTVNVNGGKAKLEGKAGSIMFK
jgi:hypothetical protein